MNDFQMMSKEVQMIANGITKNHHNREELRQEMMCQLLELPANKRKTFYRSVCRNAAQKYFNRKLTDAPVDNNGSPIMARRIYYVGGLSDLDRIINGEAA